MNSELITTLEDYSSNISSQKSPKADYFDSIISRIPQLSTKIYEYYDRIRNNFTGAVFSRLYLKSDSEAEFTWIQEAKKNVLIFGEENNCKCYNGGITCSYFNHILHATAFKSYDSCDIDPLYKNIFATNQNDGPIEDFSTLVKVLFNLHKNNQQQNQKKRSL